MYMNRVTLVGFTGAEAKHSATQGGKEITRFSLATTKGYKSANEWKDNTQWHDCVVYNVSVKAAETIQKGDHLLIEGELTYREYDRTIETAEGPVKVQWPKTEIVVYSITRLDRPAKQDRGAAA
jgi:single-strand DNA-binding protein